MSRHSEVDSDRWEERTGWLGAREGAQALPGVSADLQTVSYSPISKCSLERALGVMQFQ